MASGSVESKNDVQENLTNAVKSVYGDGLLSVKVSPIVSEHGTTYSVDVDYDIEKSYPYKAERLFLSKRT